MYKNYLSENLQYFFEIGLDKKDLAHVSDLNYSNIVNLENGLVNNPNILTVSKLAKALELSVEYLVNKDSRGEIIDFDFMKEKDLIDPLEFKLSQNVDSFIKANGYSNHKAGRMFRTCATTVRRIREDKEKMARLEICNKISKSMKVSLDELLFEEIKFQ